MNVFEETSLELTKESLNLLLGTFSSSVNGVGSSKIFHQFLIGFFPCLIFAISHYLRSLWYQFINNNFPFLFKILTSVPSRLQGSILRNILHPILLMSMRIIHCSSNPDSWATDPCYMEEISDVSFISQIILQRNWEDNL